MYSEVAFTENLLEEEEEDIDLPAPVDACRQTNRKRKTVFSKLQVFNVSAEYL